MFKVPDFDDGLTKNTITSSFLFNEKINNLKVHKKTQNVLKINKKLTSKKKIVKKINSEPNNVVLNKAKEKLKAHKAKKPNVKGNYSKIHTQTNLDTVHKKISKTKLIQNIGKNTTRIKSDMKPLDINVKKKKHKAEINIIVDQNIGKNTTRIKSDIKPPDINIKKKKHKAEINNDTLDEMLLNPKRRKLNELIEKDDQEVKLFSDYEIKKKKRKIRQLLNVEDSPVKIASENIMQNRPAKDLKIKGNDKRSNQLSSDAAIKTQNQENNVMQLQNKMSSIADNKIEKNNRNLYKTSGIKIRNRMLERLKAAQFRYLNEKLYTSSGSDAQSLFQSDPKAFQIYHEGYQQQLSKWPVNPLQIIIKRISGMPKTHIIADMGCGEASLSKSVPHTVRSFDLVATSPSVEACDMAHTPLLAQSVDVVVYCLALMGTELAQYLAEANRVLKNGGHLLIAEVESRFDNVNSFATDVEKLGFKLKRLDESHKVFFFLEFTKTREPPAKGKRPVLTLKPCLYKKR